MEEVKLRFSSVDAALNGGTSLPPLHVREFFCNSGYCVNRLRLDALSLMEKLRRLDSHPSYEKSGPQIALSTSLSNFIPISILIR